MCSYSCFDESLLNPMWVPGFLAIVAIASDMRLLITPFWSHVACLFTDSLLEPYTKAVLTSSVIRFFPQAHFPSRLSYFLFWLSSRPHKQLCLQQLTCGCHAVGLKMSHRGQERLESLWIAVSDVLLALWKASLGSLLEPGDGPFRYPPPVEHWIQDMQCTCLV